MDEARAHLGAAPASLLEQLDSDFGRHARRPGFPVLNPATGETLATVPDMAAGEAEDAIAAASAALPGWQSLTAKERARLLGRWHDLIVDNQDALAALLTAEQGKPLAEARAEILFGATYIEWFAEEAKRAYGDIIPTNAPGRRLMVLKQPIGVVAAITPWNFPSAMITRKVAPALAAGCAIVVKPAEDTPLSALALELLAHQAGLPRGVFQVVTAAHAEAVAEAFTASTTVRKLSFTGSTRVGKLLMGACANTVKKVALELGGNAPFIVFDDADLDAAVAGAVLSKFRNTGQTCVSANRLLIQASVRDAFLDRLVAAVSGLTVGDGAAPDTELGPLINRAAVEKVERLVTGAVEAGATALLGGGRHQQGENYFEPTILTGVTPSMDISRTEIFGPVAPVMTFKTEEDAVRLANETPYGLAAYFWTRDLARAWRVTEALDFGMVGVNEGMISSEAAPFGGIKESGIGREGSRYGLDEFLELKYASVGGL